MARTIRRRPNENAPVPAELECFLGAMGPYIEQDKAEFHHAGREAQEWFLRLDETDIIRVQYAVKVGFWVQTALKWGQWAFWAFTVGLGAALTAGENLQKLPATISAALSAIRGLF